MKQYFSLRRLLLCACLVFTALFSCAVHGEDDDDLRQKFESGMDYAYAEKPDYVRAVAAFTAPANSGYPRAALELGNIYRDGTGNIQQDLKTAETWYLSALEAGSPEASLELGILYEFYMKDPDTAKKYYDQYQNSGSVDSTTALLTLLYMKSALLGDASSQYEIGNCYENGSGVNADSRKAFSWYLKSANNGYAEAKNKVAEMYTSGTGVAADPQKAQEWLRNAETNEPQNIPEPKNAIQEFSQTGGSEVSTVSSSEVERITETVRNAQLGDVIYFGRYEQDNNTINGMEDLKWKVINKQGNSSLLLSYYGIDTLPYNEKWESTTWENSSLRKWLNETFYNNSFTEDEKSLIQTTNVTTGPNIAWSTQGGNDTQDKIFLLSIQEVENFVGDPTAQGVDAYLKNLNERTCEATEYAKEKEDGAYINSGKSLWGLRSVGLNNFSAVMVNSDGTISTKGSRIDYKSNVVRPAMWLTY